MPNKFKEAERQHEVDILNRFKDQGRNTIHAAASLGIADGFAWDNNGGTFVCSRMREWPERDRIKVLKNIKLFPGTYVVFYEKTDRGEKTYIYQYSVNGPVFIK